MGWDSNFREISHLGFFKAFRNTKWDGILGSVIVRLSHTAMNTRRSAAAPEPVADATLVEAAIQRKKYFKFNDSCDVALLRQGSPSSKHRS